MSQMSLFAIWRMLRDPVNLSYYAPTSLETGRFVFLFSSPANSRGFQPGSASARRAWARLQRPCAPLASQISLCISHLFAQLALQGCWLSQRPEQLGLGHPCKEFEWREIFFSIDSARGKESFSTLTASPLACPKLSVYARHHIESVKQKQEKI